MKAGYRTALGVALAALIAAPEIATTSLAAQAADPQAAAARVAAFKQVLQADQAKLRTYEWVETTAISLKGEEKARKKNRVYYGADGTLEKQPMDQAPAPAAPQAGGGGRRGGGRVKERVVENKKDDMKEYMEKAAALIQRYVPPKPEQIQAARDAGKVTVSAPEAGKVQIAFRDYVQPGDAMTIDLDPASNHLVALTVATYLEKKEDTVNLAVQFGTLNDGTGYTRQTTLDAKAKNIKVVVDNAGHRPLAR